MEAKWNKNKSIKAIALCQEGYAHSCCTSNLDVNTAILYAAEKELKRSQ